MVKSSAVTAASAVVAAFLEKIWYVTLSKVEWIIMHFPMNQKELKAHSG